MTATAASSPSQARSPQLYDAIIIGSGMGGLVTASQLASKGAKVLVLERYLIPAPPMPCPCLAPI